MQKNWPGEYENTGVHIDYISALSGYACPSCGYWMSDSTHHSCGFSYIDLQGYPVHTHRDFINTINELKATVERLTDMLKDDRCSVCGGDLLFDVEQDELEVASSPCACDDS